jgi:transcriptional regulator with XRE-family HTH domain
MDPQDVHSSEGRIDPTIGERVMLIRRRRGISQRNLAARAQMSPTALNRLERGLQSVWAERLATLARILDVSADYLG